MTNLSDIEKQLDNEVSAWYEQPFDGTLPASFNPIFRRCLMNVPPVQHNMPAGFLKALIEKKDYDLTRGDVGLMLNVIFNSPIGHYAPEGEINEQLDLLGEMGTVRTQFNYQAKEKFEYFSKKWKSLAKLSGVIIDKDTTQYKPKIYTA